MQQGSTLSVVSSKRSDALSRLNQNGQKLGAKGTRTRQKLIDVTVQLLETHGLRDLTVAEVARVAETSPATFYVYFEGVPEVVLAALETANEYSNELLDLLAHDWCQDKGLENVRHWVNLYCKEWNANRTIFLIRNLAAEEGDERFMRSRVEIASPILDALVEPIERSKKAGRVPDSLNSFGSAAAIVTLLERLAAVGPRARYSDTLNYDLLKDSAAYMIGHVLGVR